MSNDSPSKRLEYKPNVVLVNTRRCNYRCRMCFWNDPDFSKKLEEEDPIMPMDLFKRVLDEITMYCGSVSLTDWGEFVMDPLIDERLEIIGNYLRNNPQIRFDQITNASMLNEKHFEFLKGVKNITFSISIDSVDPLEYISIRRPGNLFKVKENITALIDGLRRNGTENLTIVLRSVLMKRNLFSLPNIIKYAKSIGAIVYCDHVSKYHNNDIEDESLFHYPVFANKVLSRCEKLAQTLHVPYDFPPPFAPTLSHANSPNYVLSRVCPQITTSGPVHINTDGVVTACCQPLIIGNVNKQPFSEIINGNIINEHREAIKKGNPIGQCVHCQYIRRSNKYICNSLDYGWDIKPERRNYNPCIDLEKEGFLNWIDEIKESELRKTLKYIYSENNHQTINNIENEIHEVNKRKKVTEKISSFLIVEFNKFEHVLVDYAKSIGFVRNNIWVQKVLVVVWEYIKKITSSLRK